MKTGHSMRGLRELIMVSKGVRDADLILKGGRVVNVFSNEILNANIAICGNMIAGVGDYNRGKRIIDCKGLYLLPGLIDGHIHIESTLFTPSEFARAVLPHGTTAVILDPHEIANVAGITGINYLIRAARDLPIDFFFMIPSSVPTEETANRCRRIDISGCRRLIKRPQVLGLAEVMDSRGVLNGKRDILKKIIALREYPVDGHAPGLGGHELSAYIAAGVDSDHESTTHSEAVEKMRLGMHVMIREGSLARDMRHILKPKTPLISRRSFFVSDDLLPQEILKEGHMDRVLRRAVALGVEPVKAVSMVTLNTAAYFNLKRRGGIAPGYSADIVAVNDLRDFKIRWVIKEGHLTARDGRVSTPLKAHKPPLSLMRSLRARYLSAEDLLVRAMDGDIRVIGLIPESLITHSLRLKPRIREGAVVPDLRQDIAKLVVHDRYDRSMKRGIGFVKGFRMRCGAIASSISHDAHNLIAAGMDDHDIATAINHLIKIGGGMAAVSGGSIISALSLPIGGLLSPMNARDVAGGLEDIETASEKLGITMAHPFIALSFLALSVIPHLKLTTRGLEDVKSGEVVPLFIT